MMKCTALVDDSDVESLKYSERNLYHCHCVHHKSHLVRPQAPLVPSRWETSG